MDSMVVEGIIKLFDPTTDYSSMIANCSKGEVVTSYEATNVCLTKKWRRCHDARVEGRDRCRYES